MSALPAAADPLDIRRAARAAGLLREFNAAGVLAAADVHVALRLGELAGEEDEQLLLAAALAVRGPRLGHVCVDLETIRGTVAVDAEEPVDVAALSWPEPGPWLERIAAWPLVAEGEDEEAADRPLRLVGSTLYLDRYWREERRVAADLTALAEPAEGVDEAVLAAGLERLFPGETDSRQCLAAAAAVLRRLAVVAGGPGTGKTTTVARIVALLAEQRPPAPSPAGSSPPAGSPPAAGPLRPFPLVALAAPTGKAAARLQEAVHAAAREMPLEDDVRAWLLGLEAKTLHRLLGWRPGSHSRFRHDRANRLPHDVVVVDETSMVSLSLMARLVEAVRPGARLVLVGDPGQLTSIEAGVVLGDVVGPTPNGLRMGPETRARLSAAVGHEISGPHPHSRPECAAYDAPDAEAPEDSRERLAAAESSPPIGDGIVVLDRVHRYGGAIARVAEAIRRGHADDALAALNAAPGDVRWLAADAAEPDADAAVDAIRQEVVGAATAVIDAARAGDAEAALRALPAFRLLCAHRRGPHGIAAWTERIEAWLAEAVPRFLPDGRWYAGRPLLVTQNDYGLRLYNGDAGVVVARPAGGVAAAFHRGGEVVTLAPGRLEAVETVYAMTIHKSQGSQFDTAAVLLPPPGSPILTRELLYTAVTRARKRLLVIGTEESLRAAIERPVARASGLRERLWGTR